MARGGRNLGGRGHGFGVRMPNSSSDAFNSLMSWNVVSTALNRARDTSNRYSKLFERTGEIHSENIAASRAVGYGRLTGGIDEMRGRFTGATGRAFDSSINDFFKALQKNGGANISNDKLSSTIGDLQNNIEKVAGIASGSQKDYLKDFITELKHSKKDSLTGGLSALGRDTDDIIKTSFGIKADNTIDEARKDLAASIKATSKAVADPSLKKALYDLRANLHRDSNNAKNSDEKLDAISNATNNLTYIKAQAKGSDKIAVSALQNQAIAKADTLTKSIVMLSRENRHGILQRRMMNLTRSIAGTARYLPLLKRGIDIGMEQFARINRYINGFARMQMGVSAERGAFGRSIRGAGINFSHMTSALAAGRTAGLDDMEVVNQMVGLQGNLARARWGEGPLIENLGKWGLTPFDANGNMKSNHQVMIDMSRKLNSMKDPMEKLQFLQMQGFRPDQMEYLQNYEKSAKRTEFLQAHPELMGTLDRANYLDESGFSAKADAATKTELRRREVLNQSALENGFGSYMMRKMNPENWFFSDVTARMQGVAKAKSDMAMDKLTKELADLTEEIRKNGGVVKEGSLSEKGTGLTAKDLRELSLTGGWAEESKRIYGDKSAVNILRGVALGKDSGPGSDTKKSISRTAGGVAGAGVGGAVGGLAGAGAGASAGWMVGGGLALLLGAIATAIPSGGTSLAGVAAALPMLMAGAGAIGGGVYGTAKGGAYGYQAGAALSENVYGLISGDTDSVKEGKKAAEKAKEGDTEDFEAWKKKNHVENLKVSDVSNEDFDQKAMEGARIASLVTKASERAGGKSIDLKSVEQITGDKYLGKMTQGMDKNSDEYRDQVVNAIARIADESIGRGDAMLHILQKGITVSDPDVKKRAEDIQKELMKSGKTPVIAKEIAEKKAVEEAKKDAASNGDLINAAVEQKRKANDINYEDYAKKNEQELSDDKEYSKTVDQLKEQWSKEGKSMSFEDYTKKLRNWGRGNKSWKVQAAFRMKDLEDSGPEHFNKETGKSERRHSNVHLDENGEVVGGAVTKGEKTKTKEEWNAQNWGSDEKQQIQTYKELTGKGGVLEGQDIPLDKLPEAVKNWKISTGIQEQLAHRNFGGSRNVNEKNDIAGLDDDALVAKLANETGASEEDVRNNIMTEGEYSDIQKKIENGEDISAKDRARMRIRESSVAFKKDKAKKEKEEEEKKANDTEKINDIATYTEASKILGTSDAGMHMQSVAGNAVDELGLHESGKNRLKELEERKNRYQNTPHYGKEAMSGAEDSELESLEEREKNGTHTEKLTNTEMHRKQVLEEKKNKGEITEEESKELDTIQKKESTRKLTKEDRKRMKELRAKKNGFTIEEQEEYENLSKRGQNMGNAKVDRKKLMKLVAAGGGDLTKNFSTEEIDAYNKEQADEKARLTGKGKMSEGKYKLYKDVEAKILRGEEVSDKDRELYDSTQKTLKKTSGKGFKSSGRGLHRQQAITKEERAAMAKTFGTADKLDEERKKAKGKMSLAQQSDMRLIAEAKKKGWSDKKIRQHYGEDRLGQYKEMTAKEEEEKKKISRENYEKQEKAKLKAAGIDPDSADEKTSKRGKAILAERMSSYDAKNRKKEGSGAISPAKGAKGKKKITREEFESRERAKLEATGMLGLKDGKEKLEAALKDRMDTFDATNGGGKSGEGSKAEAETVVDKEKQATAVMQEKEKGVAQASDKMASAGVASENAAESAKKANGGESTTEKNVTINLGGQTITQNIQGTQPMDKDGMKQGTLQGAGDIRDKTAEALVSVSKCKGTY